jgi:hypothetical protein
MQRQFSPAPPGGPAVLPGPIPGPCAAAFIFVFICGGIGKLLEESEFEGKLKPCWAQGGERCSGFSTRRILPSRCRTG